MIRAFLVDDEEHALNILEILLTEMGGIEVIYRTGDPFEALEKIGMLKPDVVFVDIELPGMYGIELADRIGNDQMNTNIVFVTAHDEYAIEAFEQEALDYVLKPLEEERLYKTVERIRRKVEKVPRKNNPDEPSSPCLHVCLFGGFEAFYEHKAQLKWRTAKVKELFAFLLLQADGGVHRDVIIDRLWEDEDYAKAKIYLHTCVSYLRKDLAGVGLTGIVTYKNEKYFLNRKQIVSDYHRIRTYLPEAEQQYSQDEVNVLEEALSLYKGPMLEHCDYPWVRVERERIEKEMADIQLTLAQHYLRRGKPHKAVATVEGLLQSRPYDEEVYRLLMGGYKTMGKYDEVVRISRQFVSAWQELQIEPSEETKIWMSQLKANE